MGSTWATWDSEALLRWTMLPEVRVSGDAHEAGYELVTEMLPWDVIPIVDSVFQLQASCASLQRNAHLMRVQPNV